MGALGGVNPRSYVGDLAVLIWGVYPREALLGFLRGPLGVPCLGLFLEEASRARRASEDGTPRN